LALNLKDSTIKLVGRAKQRAKEVAAAVVERRGWRWAMTSFGVDAYKASEKDLLAEDMTLRRVEEN
jgi:hypothetical protein